MTKKFHEVGAISFMGLMVIGIVLDILGKNIPSIMTRIGAFFAAYNWYWCACRMEDN